MSGGDREEDDKYGRTDGNNKQEFADHPHSLDDVPIPWYKERTESFLWALRGLAG